MYNALFIPSIFIGNNNAAILLDSSPNHVIGILSNFSDTFRELGGGISLWLIKKYPTVNKISNTAAMDARVYLMTFISSSYWFAQSSETNSYWDTTER